MTVWLSWNGLPMASTHSPTFSWLESPQGTTGRPVTSIFSSAMSVVAIGADHLAVDLALVRQRDRDVADVLADDVVVGDHVAVRRDDDARTQAERPSVTRPEEFVVVAEEVAEERVVRERRVRRLDHLQRRDVGDAL